jgi:hypothetical protein
MNKINVGVHHLAERLGRVKTQRFLAFVYNIHYLTPYFAYRNFHYESKDTLLRQLSNFL